MENTQEQDEIIRGLGFGQYMNKNSKKKKSQPQTPDEAQGRDLFQTPNYAVDLLIPFIPKREQYYFWEPAAGNGKISQRLLHSNLKATVWSTDIRETSYVPVSNILNFLGERHPFYWIERGNEPIIITNPPFSLKQRFYYRCLEYRIPFALLIPADYSGWIIDAVRIDGAEKIIPTRRIDFITPSGKSGATGNTSNFHSMWLTWGFGLGRTETYVELTNEEKKTNI